MSRPHIRTPLIAVLGVAVTATVVVGCGSSNKSSSSSTSAGTLPSAAASAAGSGGTSGSSASAAPSAAASSSGSSASVKGDASNPCTLLADSQVSGWLGGAMVRTIGPRQVEKGTTCTWVGGNGAFLTLAVTQQAWDPTHLPGSPVSGIGDAAVVGPTLAAGHKGNTIVIVTGGNPAKLKDALAAAVNRL